MGKHYKVRYTLNPEGGWTVEVLGNPGGSGCISEGNTIRSARERIREALALCLEDEKAAEAAAFDEEIVAPGGLRNRVKKLRATREKLAKLEAESAAETRSAARALSDQGLTIRDAGEVLGISFQRVHQLLAKDGDVAYTPERPRRPAGRRSKSTRVREREKKRA